MNQLYLDTARLLVQVAPLVFVDDMFALKGGTAINLFVRDMPRLSVDIDLVFVDFRLGRDAALQRINQAIQEAADRLRKRGFQVYLPSPGDAVESYRLFVRRKRLEVRVEANYVMRGTVHPVPRMSITAVAREALLAELELPVLSPYELYGSKLVAAMDRQHPRDLYDVMHLFLHGGITPEIRRCFLVYLVCHGRPIHELLSPRLRDISGEFERTFQGMTEEPVDLEALLSVRERMIREIQGSLNAGERTFLFSFARGEPAWDLLEIEHLSQLPAIRWKLENLQRLAERNPMKLEAHAAALERLLS